MLTLTSLFSGNIDFKSLAIVTVCILGSLILLGLLVRLLFGKDSPINHALSACLGIVMIYAVSIAIYTFQPGNLSQILSPLPFVRFSGASMTLFSFQGSVFPEICTQVLSMVILAFLVNLMGGFFKSQTKIHLWLMSRVTAVIMAMLAHYLTHVVLLVIFPNALQSYAPMILLCILIFMLSLGFLKTVLGLLLVAVNPVIGALYGFFFASKIGKQLTQAVFTALIMCALVYLLGHLGFGVISISGASMVSCLPFLAGILLIWYLIGCLL